jgi:hypothetical protein
MPWVFEMNSEFRIQNAEWEVSAHSEFCVLNPEFAAEGGANAWR